ncbi:hypothetical protein DPMN_060052 [Dreissena polymorpha]|uniref:Uncharacterized protein n=1 Tax=Dreissena polymorpha TaxID=45954 RepID=A0A9D4C558_DREPO|nr:hypothetical protein DPMN_060052 [Dreissena polymorpha]
MQSSLPYYNSWTDHKHKFATCIDTKYNVSTLPLPTRTTSPSASPATNVSTLPLPTSTSSTLTP